MVNDKPYQETPLTGKKSIVWNQKYRHDLFYILPYYYLELPASINKLILLDIDLEFSIDMLSLYKQFNQFSPTEVIGCGVTQTPFYLKYFEDYKSHHPGTENHVQFSVLKSVNFTQIHTLVDPAGTRDSTLGSFSWTFRKCGKVSSI